MSVYIAYLFNTGLKNYVYLQLGMGHYSVLYFLGVRNDNFLVFSLRKGVEVNVWDLEQDTKIWTAKSVSLCISTIALECVTSNI